MIGKPEKMETEDRKTKKTDLGKTENHKTGKPNPGKTFKLEKTRKKTFKPQNVQMGKLNKNKKTRKTRTGKPKTGKLKTRNQKIRKLKTRKQENEKHVFFYLGSLRFFVFLGGSSGFFWVFRGLI